MKETMMRSLTLAAMLMATPAAAQDLPIADDKVVVLACLEKMEISTTWNQCLDLMFQPCAAETPGTEGHAACLTGVRDDWSGAVQLLQNDVMEVVTTNGANQVLNLIVIWTDFVSQKCDDVAQSRAQGAESARLGCEVSELAGLTDEFAACLQGRSTAEYCELKE